MQMSVPFIRPSTGKGPKQSLKLEIPTNGFAKGHSRGSSWTSDDSSESTASMMSQDQFTTELVARLELANTPENTSIAGMSQKRWQDASQNGDIVEIKRLGEGSGGSVKLCKLRGHTELFALKEIAANPNEDIQKQVLRELQFNCSCASPFIVKYYGAFLGADTGSMFIAMEYCEYGSLDSLKKKIKERGGRIGEKALAKIAESVLKGITYLYDRSIIHRDIKPQNILLNGNGQVKLCDFGVSGQVVNSLATTFTGTSFYMAPERIQGQPYTVTSDVWSLGLTLLELSQCKFPFQHENDTPLMPIELLAEIVKMPSPKLQDEPESGIKWSKSFHHFTKCCLEKDPSKRPSPQHLLSHPWIVGHAQKTVKMEKFLKECWSEA